MPLSGPGSREPASPNIRSFADTTPFSGREPMPPLTIGDRDDRERHLARACAGKLIRQARARALRRPQRPRIYARRARERVTKAARREPVRAAVSPCRIRRGATGRPAPADAARAVRLSSREGRLATTATGPFGTHHPRRRTDGRKGRQLLPAPQPRATRITQAELLENQPSRRPGVTFEAGRGREDAAPVTDVLEPLRVHRPPGLAGPTDQDGGSLDERRVRRVQRAERLQCVDRLGPRDGRVVRRSGGMDGRRPSTGGAFLCRSALNVPARTCSCIGLGRAPRATLNTYPFVRTMVLSRKMTSNAGAGDGRWGGTSRSPLKSERWLAHERVVEAAKVEVGPGPSTLRRRLTSGSATN